jgi:hypothetical protein
MDNLSNGGGTNSSLLFEHKSDNFFRKSKSFFFSRSFKTSRNITRLTTFSTTLSFVALPTTFCFRTDSSTSTTLASTFRVCGWASSTSRPGSGREESAAVATTETVATRVARNARCRSFLRKSAAGVYKTFMRWSNFWVRQMIQSYIGAMLTPFSCLAWLARGGGLNKDATKARWSFIIPKYF